MAFVEENTLEVNTQHNSDNSTTDGDYSDDPAAHLPHDPFYHLTNGDSQDPRTYYYDHDRFGSDSFELLAPGE